MKTKHPWFVLVLLSSTAAWGDQPRTASYLGTVGPGDRVALVLKLGQEITTTEQTDNTLDPRAVAALLRVPTWVHSALRESLRRMDLPTQQGFSDAILAAKDEIVDEVAFVVAHLAPEDRAYTTPELIRRNAELIYAIAPELGYVELVEHGTAGKDADWYTTLRYQRLEQGKPAAFELPRDDYYWWVVHPVLAREPFTTIDPGTGKLAKPPAGVIWREYLLAAMDSQVSPRKHYIMRQPNTITDADLQSAGATAHGSLGPTEVGPNEVIRGPAAEPVLVEYNPTGWKCCSATADYPMPDGIYLATTIPLEQLAHSGHPELLENLLLAGPGRRALRDWDVVSWSPYAKEARKVLIVRDRIPFGAQSDPNETLLTKNGLGYDLLDSQAFAALVDGGNLSSASKPLFNLSHVKIVVPSDQPRALYEVFAARAAAVDSFVTNGGSFELHGATSESDDWSDLTMPGRIRTTPQKSASHIQQVHEYGNALLRDVMAGVSLLWDGVRRCSRFAKDTCPPGDRKMQAGDDAIDRIGWWSGQMVDRCVTEHRTLAQLSTGQSERSSFPQRIVAMHYGNCGEQHIEIGAATRAALIPSMLVLSVEDHVWNEFYAGGGQWYPYDMGYSDSPIRVADWSVGRDASTRENKNVQNAVIIGWRGDGQIVNLLGRYPTKMVDGLVDYEYTPHLELTVTVLDADKRPVDGAVVTLITESYFSAAQAVPCLFGVTGRDGRATMRIGDERNFYVNVASAIGHYPQKMALDKSVIDVTQFKPLLLKQEAVAGAKIERTITLAETSRGKVATYKVQQKTPPAPVAGATYHRATIDLQVVAEYQSTTGSLSRRTFVETTEPGRADLYVVDRDNYGKLEAGKDFTALLAREGVSEISSLTLDLPGPDDEWYVVVSNSRQLSHAELAQLSVQLVQVSPDQPEETDGKGGCGCRLARPRRAPTALLLAVLLGALVWRRRASVRR